MKGLHFSLLLSSVLLLGCSVSAFAKDKKHDHKNDHNRYEQYQKDKSHRNDKHYDNYLSTRHYDRDKYDKKAREKWEKEQKKRYKAQEKRYHEREKFMRKYHHDRQRDFWEMVRYVSRGGRDVRVWQISDDAYIVRYLLGGRYYTQRIYPYSGRYGGRSVININWTPSASWLFIPEINIHL